MEQVTCCFTGHRTIPSAKAPSVQEKLVRSVAFLAQKGYRIFVAGGALGFDTMAAKAVLEVKKRFPDIALHLVLPCPEQDKLWNKKQKEEYADILSKANSHEYVCDSYTRWCMSQRNKRMIDMSSAVITYYDGSGKGGTAMTVGFAKEKGIGIINLF